MKPPELRDGLWEKLLERAEHSVTLRACLDSYLARRCSFAEAMTTAAICLDDEREQLFKIALNAAQFRPPSSQQDELVPASAHEIAKQRRAVGLDKP